MNYTGAVWRGNEAQCYNYATEKSLSSRKLVSTSVKATTTALILYSAQFIAQIEIYFPWLKSLWAQFLETYVMPAVSVASSSISTKFLIVVERIVVILLSLQFLII